MIEYYNKKTVKNFKGKPYFFVRDVVSHRKELVPVDTVNKGMTLRNSHKIGYMVSSKKYVPCKVLFCNWLDVDEKRLVRVSEKDFKELRKNKIIL